MTSFSARPTCSLQDTKIRNASPWHQVSARRSWPGTLNDDRAFHAGMTAADVVEGAWCRGRDASARAGLDRSGPPALVQHRHVVPHDITVDPGDDVALLHDEASRREREVIDRDLAARPARLLGMQRQRSAAAVTNTAVVRFKTRSSERGSCGGQRSSRYAQNRGGIGGVLLMPRECFPGAGQERFHLGRLGKRNELLVECRHHPPMKGDLGIDKFPIDR